MGSRLSGQTSIFGIAFFVSKYVLGSGLALFLCLDRLTKSDVTSGKNAGRAAK